MKEYFISAKECKTNFEEMGIKMSESNFSKNKKKGFFRVHRIENSKRDFFIWNEVIESYFELTYSKDIAEDKIREKFFAEKKEREKQEILLADIDTEWYKLNNYKTLTFEMFDIESLWIDAQEDLKELKNKEIEEETKERILLDAAKTKDDHIQGFKCEVLAQNAENEAIRWFMVGLFDDLSSKYPTLTGHKLQLDILKNANSKMMTPKDFANSFGVDLIKVDVL